MRAALAGSLLESLDETVDVSAEEEWSREIARRMEELDSASEADSMGGSAPANLRPPQWPLGRLIIRGHLLWPPYRRLTLNTSIRSKSKVRLGATALDDARPTLLSPATLTKNQKPR